MRKFPSQEIKEFVSKPLFDEEVVLKKDSSYPKITVVTPSYNQAEFLERTLLSVLNQNYPNLEYIIIDGGSSDGSVEIIKKYEKYLACWVSEPDKGQSDAINEGFRIARGELIGWQNSDDIYLPGAFHKIVRIFIENSDIDLVFGNSYFIDENDNTIRDLRFTPFDYKSLIYEGTVLANQAAFWKKGLFDKVGLLNDRFRFCIDYDFWVRVGKAGKFYFLRDYLGAFRIHSDTKTSTIHKIGHQEHIGVLTREGIGVNSMSFKLWRAYCLMRRAFFYFVQGDIDYVLRGVNKRLFNA